MKHLLTAIACCMAVACFGQGTTIYEYPWNPDWNNDNFVGSSDLTGFLSAFGSEFGNPPEPCDYDGTPLEEFAIGVIDGSIILDSIFIEYELEDVATYYLLGCPDPVTDTVIVANSFMFQYFEINATYWYGYANNGGGGYMDLFFQANTSNGTYGWDLYNASISEFADDNFFGSISASSAWVSLPFPEGWFLDESGIHLSGWSSNEWPYYANYLHILPYWHYAE